MSNKKISLLIVFFLSILNVFPQNGIQFIDENKAIKENNRMSKNLESGMILKNFLEGSKTGLSNDDKKRIELAIQKQVEAHRKKKKEIEESNWNDYIKRSKEQIRYKQEIERQEALIKGEQAAAKKKQELQPIIENISNIIDNRGNLSLHANKVNIQKIKERQKGNMTPHPYFINKTKKGSKSNPSTNVSKKSLSELLKETGSKKEMTEKEYKKWLIKNVPEYKQLTEEETELEKLLKELF